jgi:hypothetical protein
MNKPSSAETYIGKHLLVGITYLDHEENVVEQVQLHGTITKIDETVIAIRLNDSDEEFTLPPDLDAIQEAAPGEYRLRSTGEVVINPDFLGSWTVILNRTIQDWDSSHRGHRGHGEKTRLPCGPLCSLCSLWPIPVSQG